ncbi:outer membrane protein assembly factor [Rhizobium sp. CG5]|uniref:autotransporter assembly complex protein TamA n=1 Tax=Rhizobium sp. CG5 TaxID=2726076 RepID=UPI002033EBC1|nr:autotransporter assembly complex family protein [Rhizobium sp. CG5]MCM2475257.1 outer membrane protein assembly factor [Rhizobium sp. CG5]
MPSRSTSPKVSIAFRKACTGLAVATTLSLCPLAASEAYAFKLFGITIFGEPETANDVIDPVTYKADLSTSTTDKDLREVLENSSRLVQEADKPVSGDLGLVIKARDDRDRLLAALYENARYGGVVTVEIDGLSIDALPPNPVFDHAAPVPVTIKVEPGPVFTLGRVSLTGDAAELEAEKYDLVPGGSAGSLLILKAADKIVGDLKAGSRPLARLTAREVVADHQALTVDVTIGADGGPVAPLGPVSVSGTKTVDANFIRRYSRLNEGKPYSPEDLRKAGDRLRKLGVFSSVSIREDEKLAADGSIPLGITVSEGKHRYFGAGTTISTIDGFGLEGYWGHRNLFGEAESLRIEGSVGGIGETTDATEFNYSAGILFSKPGAFFPSATLNASIKAATLNTDSYDSATVTGLVGLSYELTDYDTVSASTSLEYADIDDAFGNNQYLTFAIPLEYVRDARDNKLNPTEGYRAAIEVTPSYEILGSTVFSSFEATASAYRSVGEDDRVVFAGQVSLGTLFGGGGLADIPATRRFYAGGGGSVRGYAFQEISPYNADDEATGGRSYALASLEARIKITETIGLVPFLDAGTVSTANIPDFSDIRMGAGIGLRYATPFGPIRFDVAMPLEAYPDGASYGIYVGIGQSF